MKVENYSPTGVEIKDSNGVTHFFAPKGENWGVNKSVYDLPETIGKSLIERYPYSVKEVGKKAKIPEKKPEVAHVDQISRREIVNEIKRRRGISESKGKKTIVKRKGGKGGSSSV